MKNKVISVFISILFLYTLTGILYIDVYAKNNDCTTGKHNYSTVRTEPTPNTDGEVKYQCNLCEHTYRQIIPATNHHWGEWIIDQSPTCTETGQRHRTCTTTSQPHREHEEIPPLKHDYTVTTTGPSCNKGGVKTYTCKLCTDSYQEDSGNPIGHDYKEEITKPATFDEEGVTSFACKRCSDTYTEPLPVQTQHEHQYVVKKEIQASCTAAGEITRACVTCKDTYTESIPASMHNWAEWITDKNANLTADGLRHRVCINDSSHTEEEIIPKGITFEVTPAAIAINTGSFILLSVSVLTLGSEFRILAWERRKRKQYAEFLKKGSRKT